MNPTRIRLISEGVVASYIHDISVRTRSADSSPPADRHGGRSSRLAHSRAALRGRDAHQGRRTRPGELAVTSRSA